ncbi:MAG: hypothetical protein LBB81_01345 [Treponema sp.]|jgi:hypothetical protein|nr:hypothetical protein [Treponema sp.]
MTGLKIAVDFDGTCVQHEFPNIGRDIGSAPVLRRCVDAGHKLILNTMRSGKSLKEAIEWFKNKGIKLYGVYDDPDQYTWTQSPKCYAHIYIDDAALGCPLVYPKQGEGRPYVDWKKVEQILFKDGGSLSREPEKIITE